MSLLREAEKCLLNQHRYAGLNALITPLQPHHHRQQPTQDTPSSSPSSWRSKVREADLRREQGTALSRIDGHLITIKDNICTLHYPTTCASAILDTKYTSPFNATVVERLEAAGAVVAGKTNLDEFGMGSHSVNSRFGPVKNTQTQAYTLAQHTDTHTHTHDRSSGQVENRELLTPGEAWASAGGSSGGSAVAVATGQCHAALGTDTGGSVRLPAAYTGTVGFKPSYGLVSRWGVVAYANSLDTVGIIGRDTASVRDIFHILNQHDPRDPTNLSPSSRSRIHAHLTSPDVSARISSRPLQIGVPVEYNISELAPSVRRAWLLSLSHLQKQGHSLHPVSLPATKQALSAYYVLAPAEASSNLAKYDGVRYGVRAAGPDSDAARSDTDGYLFARTRGQGFGAEVKRRILLGTFSLSADAMDNYFLQAQRVRRLVQRDFDRVFRAGNPLSATPNNVSDGINHREGKGDVKVDILICPTAPTPPPLLKDLIGPDAISSPLDAYVNDVFTVPASLAGLPALSVPVSISAEKKGEEALQNSSSSGVVTTGIQVLGQYGDDELVLDVGKLLEGRTFVDSQF